MKKLRLHSSLSSWGGSLWDTWTRIELELPLSSWEISFDVLLLANVLLQLVPFRPSLDLRLSGPAGARSQGKKRAGNHKA